MAQGTGLRILPATGEKRTRAVKRERTPRPEKQVSAQFLSDLWEVSVPTINRWTLHPSLGEKEIPSIKVTGSRRYPLKKALRWWDEHNGWNTRKEEKA